MVKYQIIHSMQVTYTIANMHIKEYVWHKKHTTPFTRFYSTLNPLKDSN